MFVDSSSVTIMFAPSQRRFPETITNNSDSTECTKVKCRCGLEAALKVSSSGRKYLGCPRRAAAGQCEFTRMLPNNAQEGASPTHNLNMDEPTGSQHEIDPVLAHPPCTATLGPVNHMKRTPPAIENDDDPEMLPSQKRAKLIAAVLRESAGTNSRPHSDHESPTNAIPNPSPALPSNSPGPALTDTKYQEVRAETTASHHVNGSSHSIGSSSGKMGPSSLDGAPSSRAVNTDRPWLLHTPKRTEFERSASMTSVLSSVELSPVQISRGKHRVNEEWCKEKAVVVSQLSEESPSKRFSAVSLAHALEGLSGLPNHLRALEEDHEIKNMKIKHLENEVQRLKNTQGELEKLLQMYEQRSSIIEQGT